MLVIVKKKQKVVKHENYTRPLIHKWCLDYSPVFLPRLRD